MGLTKIGKGKIEKKTIVFTLLHIFLRKHVASNQISEIPLSINMMFDFHNYPKSISPTFYSFWNVQHAAHASRCIIIMNARKLHARVQGMFHIVQS